MIKINVIQANINRSRSALDLLLQQAKELRVGLLAISEPNNVPDVPNWFSSLDRSAAVFVDSSFIKLTSNTREVPFYGDFPETWHTSSTWKTIGHVYCYIGLKAV